MNVGVCHALYIVLIHTWSYGAVGMVVMFVRL